VKKPSQMSKTEIFVLHPSSGLYGADITLLQLIKGLNKENLDCTVALP